jgi:DUF4097 and DUF4098 domain-containing protein YvlB
VLPWDRAFSFPEEVTSEVVATDAALDILIPRGNIEIVAEEASQIRAVVSKRAYAFSERDARRAADQASLRIVKTDSGYALQPEWREGRRLGNIYFDLTVHVPRSMPLRIQSVRGNLRAAGLTGRLDVELRRGDVEIRNAGSAVRVKLRQGDVRIHAVRGDVIVEGPGDLVEVSEVAGALTIQGNFSGPIQISRVQGETTFRSSRTNLSVGRIAGQLELSGGQLTLTDSSGPVSLITRSYDITMENIEGELRIENRSSGDIRLQFRRPPQQPVQVRNEKGDIELTLPAEATFALQAIAQRGEIESDFTGAGLEKTDREEAVELRGRVGARGPNIRLETTYGTIRLRRGP